MLDRYIGGGCKYLQIPHIDEHYVVDCDGVIRDLNNLTIVASRNGKVTVHVGGIEYLVNVANLVQITWKPVYVEDFLFYLVDANVIHIGGNLNYYHPMSLIWDFTESRHEYGFRIPGFSRYILTEDYRIYDLKKKYYLNLNYSKRDYVFVEMSPDYLMGSKRTTPVHRIVAYSRLPYTDKVCKLDVNHLDGDKHNYMVTNLEFTTRSGNNNHAQITGLKKDSNTVEVTDITTGEVRSFHSQAECGRQMNIDISLISWRLKRPAGTVFDGKYIFRITKQQCVREKFTTVSKTVVIKNIRTGEILEFGSLAKAATFIGINYAALKKRYQRDSTIFGDWHLKAYNPKLNEDYPTFE
jgi:hypothetical protein